jgi:Radical SAM superfamily
MQRQFGRMGKQRFKIVLIVPSHYDDDGYVIQWLRSLMPSNSLASVYGLLKECADSRVLGDDVDIDIDAYDETNTVIKVNRIIRSIRAADAGFVGLVGVQSNQYPRGLDLGRSFRAAGIPVVMGGFHVSGCISMLRELPPDLQAALDLGISLFAGEAEGRMAGLLRDIDRSSLKPIYNYLSDMPALEAAPAPVLPRQAIARVLGKYASFDAGRGCPYQCSFCTIINVQGRKSRYRTADDVEAIVRAQAKQKVTRFFITDDNFARNRNWEAILDRLIELREKEKFKIRLLIQVDTLCHRIPNFVEKCGRAGVLFAFIGLENINPQSLMGTKKRQNKIWEYREMLQAWRRSGVITYCGYILGFPSDTPESIARDIDIIKRELPLDILQFYILTPLPGSEDHKVLHEGGVALDLDMNKYDLEHACTAHPIMSLEVLERAYHDAWKRYYTDEHVQTIFRRAHASGVPMNKVGGILTWVSGSNAIERVHPLQFGFFRRKVRSQRRSGMPIESRLTFYPRRVLEVMRTCAQWAVHARKYQMLRKRAVAELAGKTYVDEALAPPPTDAAEDHLIQAFAAQIPKMHGAPRLQVAAPDTL